MEHPNTPLPDRIARAVADYHAELYRFAALRTGSRSDAEDIVQEAFLRLLTAPGEITHLRAYLYRCVANACCDRKRRQAVFEPLGPQLPVDNGEAPLREEAERIAALLDRLRKSRPRSSACTPSPRCASPRLPRRSNCPRRPSSHGSTTASNG